MTLHNENLVAQRIARRLGSVPEVSESVASRLHASRRQALACVAERGPTRSVPSPVLVFRQGRVQRAILALGVLIVGTTLTWFSLQSSTADTSLAPEEDNGSYAELVAE
jgi:hypothetical protein